MPKDPSSRSLLSSKSRGTRCRLYQSNGREASRGSSSKDVEEIARKDWEESTCPICMESPHNAILLLCSSQHKGCRPYMCDTSYRHSNCLDRYRKAKTSGDKNSDRDSRVSLESVTRAPVNVMPFEISDEVQRMPFAALPFNNGLSTRREEAPIVGAVHGRVPGLDGGVLRSHPLLPGLARTSDEELLTDSAISLGGLGLEDERAAGGATGGDAGVEVADLLCPLCSGKVFGWTVVERARHQLNRKPRGCAQEGCNFTGTYIELREHARNVHPSARPSDIDPVRQRDWLRLERQSDVGDVPSTIISAMPRATVFGNYVIHDCEEEDDSDFPGDDGHWWTVFLLFQAFGDAAPFGGRRLLSRMRRRARGLAVSPLMRWALLGDLQGTTTGGRINNMTGNTVNMSEVSRKEPGAQKPSPVPR